MATSIAKVLQSRGTTELFPCYPRHCKHQQIFTLRSIYLLNCQLPFSAFWSLLHLSCVQLPSA